MWVVERPDVHCGDGLVYELAELMTLECLARRKQNVWSPKKACGFLAFGEVHPCAQIN